MEDDLCFCFPARGWEEGIDSLLEAKIETQTHAAGKEMSESTDFFDSRTPEG